MVISGRMADVCAELDRMLECGLSGSVYFVDDNLIGNRKALLELLPHLIEWQKRTGYNLRFSGDRDGAEAAFARVLEIEPDNRPARTFLAALREPARASDDR